MRQYASNARPPASLSRSRLPLGNYGWLKRGLAPCPPRQDEELRALAATMTAGDVAEHPTLPAGYTYFGQLLAHDLSFQSATAAQRRNDPDALHNFRSPAFDLDSLYGRGPLDQPYLYQYDTPWKLLTGRTRPAESPLGEDGEELEDDDGGLEDLPRNALGEALVGDPRNDQHLLVSRLHLALIHLHNRFADLVEAQEGKQGFDIFERARTLTTWHYQWVVLHDYLPRILQPAVMSELLAIATDGRSPGRRRLRHFDPAVGPYLPHEFVGAAFRFGHSTVREGYVLNRELDQQRKGVPIPPFDPEGDKDPRDPRDLRGRRPIPAGWGVEPSLLLDLGDPNYQRALLIDTHLSSALASVPTMNGPESMAYLDLHRGQALGLASGQALARAMGINRVLDSKEAEPNGAAGQETPLWYYLLKEAELEEGGHCLGELGSTIVGEVMVGLLLMDPSSFLSCEPRWQPLSLGQQGELTLGDLVRYSSAGP